ncbi:hypothetical protein A2962_04980 [Candidatus Woesebacteria bacterium RIFCSPLOWO2_01_FULL_39_61]|uniref:Glycosyltransferase 2-like domain-containing protein n=1 Tax=Candidatus Woesebacteria bacterium RIFCSPHIGHO2_02_FULL_39_13 TaxID=1802505 RepID=A0A1F7YZ67_9BACT|nr:MAG: hypothetical protein A2692_03230 [Candidatus Woesebacteria bacterium RIFCSPHIGHO2_01_FULL_39_95]OGM32622.1 MAG: hypothetical protein A3D01_05205 [Candidatus Woesebacteria bacterium RIFCSPHIGHO2_02_FULL_39_13]OGM36419.1 MAG: hypothetical protein A3E13_00750 [Candidatus Woesebacteria bacterium RIFCSPHIGHO2_12_FULL_40_20]OGM66690.1 MAG: hypothetical protein A2962_04980 [Candidatus Woesebacteria bacterium RIFCSPLOWO2_01_FULL_39_61]OGM73024.1 MAG: hypothetical protein A3H19_03115 [Candidatus
MINKIRKSILLDYCRKNNLSITPGIKLCRPNTKLTVVIPAYNEEKFIDETLLSLGNIPELIEIVVVNNGSSDKTKDVVNKISQHIKWPIYLLECLQKGPVYARKRGMDEVVIQYLVQNPEATKLRYIALTDADTIVNKNWVKVIIDTFRKTNASAVGGIHGYPNWIDEEIEKVTGIKNFFEDLVNIAYYLSENGLALVQTNGANFAIEVVAYSEVGGSRQPTDERGNPVKGSDRLFGYSLRDRGKLVSFIPTITITSPRRTLFSLSQGKDPAYFRDIKRWVDVRDNEISLIHKAARKLRLKDWMENKRLREISFVEHNIIQPAIKGQLSLLPLRKLMGSNHPLIDKIVRVINDTHSATSTEADSYTSKIAGSYTQELLDTVRTKILS